MFGNEVDIYITGAIGVGDGFTDLLKTIVDETLN